MGIMIFMLKSQRRAFRWPNNLRARLYDAYVRICVLSNANFGVPYLSLGK